MQLIQGDCLELLGEIQKPVDMVFADLPYGTTAAKWDYDFDLKTLWKSLNKVVRPETPVVMTSTQPFTTRLISSNLKEFKYAWVWTKTSGATGHLNAKKQPLRSTEDVCVFYHSQCSYFPQMGRGEVYFQVQRGNTSKIYGSQTGQDNVVNDGSRYPTNVLKFSSSSQKKYHPSQKPLALMEYLLKTYTQPGDVVLDPVMGSGSMGLACKRLKRKFIGIELDPTYFETAKKRINRSTWGAGL